MTLIELIVAMSIFMIFVSLIIGTTLTLARSASRAQLVAESSNAALTVFGAFDRQTRYADSINYPGTGPSGARYVEFRTPGNSAASGVTTCTQWRFVPSLARFESRTWNDLPAATPGAWATKLSNVVDDGADYPFSLIPAVVAVGSRQQLVVKIHAGNGSLDAGATVSTSFAARNSSSNSPSNADANNDGVSDAPICPAGARP